MSCPLVRISYKHLSQDFITKHKIFIFKVIEAGSVARITERNRVQDFTIRLDLGGAYWLRTTIGEALETRSNGGFRSFPLD